MATVTSTERRLLKRLIDQLGVLASDTLGGIIGHIVITKIEGEGETAKRTRELNKENLRDMFPYLLKSAQDEAVFSSLVGELPAGLQKNLERQMGRLQYGPFRVGVTSYGIGDNQRADIIIKITNIIPAAEGGRARAIVTLTQLASIMDTYQWRNRAVAFRLMKENEQDYWGAYLPSGIKSLLAKMVAQSRVQAAEMRMRTNEIERDLQARNNANPLMRLWYGMSRAFSMRIT